MRQKIKNYKNIDVFEGIADGKINKMDKKLIGYYRISSKRSKNGIKG